MFSGKKLLKLVAICHLGIMHRKLFDAVLWCVQTDKGHGPLNRVIHPLGYIYVVRVYQYNILDAFFFLVFRCNLTPYTTMLAPYVGEGELGYMVLNYPNWGFLYNHVVLGSCLLQFFT